MKESVRTISLFSYPPFTEGRFIKRINRFVCEVEIAEEKTTEKAHLPTTGRLAELLVEGAKLFLERHNSPERKTSLTLRLVEYQGVLIDLTAHYANRYAQAFWKKGLLNLPYSSSEAAIKAEWKYRHHRFDFLITPHNEKNPPLVVEVKSVNLVEKNQALFPDAPTVRGEKHLRNLTELTEKGYKTALLFMIMREDADCFRTHERKDPAFTRACREAKKKGVGIHAYRCRITKEKVYAIQEELPVLW